MSDLKLWQKIRPNLSFRGPDGIRAGWSIAIFLAITLAILTPIQFGLVHIAEKWYHFKFPPVDEIPPAMFLVFEAASTLALLAITAIMARIEGRSLWDYGLASPRGKIHFCAGWAGGFLCLSVLAGLLVWAGNLVVAGFALHGANALFYGLIYFVGFGLTGISEEITNRGYFQYTLARGLGFWPGAVISSGIFAIMHLNNHGETFLGIAQVFCAGIVFCALLRESGSLWMSIGFHAAWDWAQSYFYGTPDSATLFKGHLLISHATGSALMSGGSAGPEGSALATPVMIAGPLLLLWIGRQAGLFGQSIEKDDVALAFENR